MTGFPGLADEEEGATPALAGSDVKGLVLGVQELVNLFTSSYPDRWLEQQIAPIFFQETDQVQQSVLEVPPPADVRIGGNRSPVMRDYVAMTKPGVNRMVVLTTLIGGLLAFSPLLPFTERLASAGLLVVTLIGTYLLAAASAVFNMILERDRDRRMERTRTRPVASGRVSVAAAFGFGALLTLSGSLLLGFMVNAPTLLLGLLTLGSYLFIYTPLKGVTPWSTYLGAIPGALPPVMGFTAIAFGRVPLAATDWDSVSAALSPSGPGVIAWVLFGILFFWQLPHFFAIGWIHRDDYARGGHAMLSVADKTGRRSGVESVVNAGLLLVVALVPWWTGNNGPIYALGAVAVGAYFLVASVRFAMARGHLQARRLLIASLLYLPASLLLLFLQRTPF
jgi:heme O synthase-like polyprenyltransferase